MVIPQFLKPGDLVGIIAPAGKVNKDYIDFSCSYLESVGLRVLMGKHIMNEHYSFAGTDIERAEDLQYMLDHPEIKAIICARGGYGTIRLMDKINFNSFKKAPKWIVGFSDITILHAYCNNVLDIATLHGVMPINYRTDGAEESLHLLKETLFGILPEYSFPSSGILKEGKATGNISGGNLSVLFGLRGSEMDFEPDNKILFIEDVGEKVYHLDRLLQNYKHTGVFNKINGLVVGGMTDVNDERFLTGQTITEIIQETISDIDIPVIYDFPAGHQPRNFPLIMGATSEIEVSMQKMTLKYLS